MNILLDTHILVWWCLDNLKLPRSYANILEQMETKKESLAISVISLWEIAKLVSLGKLIVKTPLPEWFPQLENNPSVIIIPLNPKIALDSTNLGSEFPKDPADQLIAATARHHHLPLMTVDEKIIRSKKVAVVPQ